MSKDALDEIKKELTQRNERQPEPEEKERIDEVLHTFDSEFKQVRSSTHMTSDSFKFVQPEPTDNEELQFLQDRNRYYETLEKSD